MKTVFRIIFFVPLALIILFFAMANRTPVQIGLDPFLAPGETGPSFEAPLFLVVLVSMALGVVAGGASTWVSHLPVRRAAKVARAEVKKTKVEIDKLRQQALSSLPAEPDNKA
jgi:uncharacterized integral membrane protein